MDKVEIEAAAASAAALRRVETPLLDVAYVDQGPSDAPCVLLLHGWPDDIRTWDGIAPALRSAGFRTIVPYLRGFGATRFRHSETRRTGQLAALATDALDLADALGIDRFAVVGHDWGARAAYITSCAAPERVSACAGISVGWGTNDPEQSLTLRQTQNYWYHWLMALPRGASLIREDRRRLTRYIWDIWNSGFPVSDDAFSSTATSFDNSDWAEVTLHSYRVRWGHAAADPDYLALEAKLVANSVISVPTLTLHGGEDPCNDPTTSEGREALFSGYYRRSLLPGLGHFPQRQDPDAVLRELLPSSPGRQETRRRAADRPTKTPHVGVVHYGRQSLRRRAGIESAASCRGRPGRRQAPARLRRRRPGRGARSAGPCFDRGTEARYSR